MNHPKKSNARFQASFFQDSRMFFRITYEFWRGVHFMRRNNRAVTIFGSARLLPDHPYCEQARALARMISEKGVAIITGGGPSIMQAANQGAMEGGAPSYGINIQLPREQKPNPYVSRALKCHYFFVRKVLLCRYSEAFVVFPGGFGTLDEFFELITLVQTQKMIERPVVLIGTEFWKGLISWCRDSLLSNGMITEAELARICVVDKIEDALQVISL